MNSRFYFYLINLIIYAIIKSIGESSHNHMQKVRLPENKGK